MTDLKHEFYELLQADESVFEFIQAVALEGFWYWDLENPHRRWFNAKCYAMLDYSPDSVPNWPLLFHPDERSAAAQWSPGSDHPSPLAQETQLRYLHRNQTIVEVTCQLMLIYNQAGKAIRMVGAQTRVTPQKKQTPLESDQQIIYQNLLGNQSIYVIKTDLNGNYTFVNDYYCQAFALNANELLGTFSLNSIYPADHGLCQEAVTQCLSQPGNVCKVRLRKPLPNGQLRYTQWEFIAQLSPISQVTELLCIGYDVSDSARVEDDLSVLMNNTREALLSINREGVLRLVTPSWSRLYGHAIQETVGKPFVAFIHPEDITSWETALDQVTRDGISLVVEQRIRHKQGHWLWCAAQLSIDLSKEEIFITSYQITDQKQAQDAHQSSEQRFREIAENVDEAFWIHLVEPFELTYINSAYERVFGLSAPRLAAEPTFFLETILEPDQALVRAGFEQYRRGQEVTLQCRVLDIRRQVRWLQIRTFVMTNSQAQPVRYIGIVSDISAQKEKELVLEQSLSRQQALSQLKSQFVSTASHEFRTPLTTIQSSVDLIKLYLDLPTGRGLIQKHLGIIQREIEKFSTMLTDLLTIGRIEAGKIAFNPRWLDLTSQCEGVITLYFNNRSDKRRVQLLIEGTPQLAYVDDKLLGHVLTNLLSNAFKFSRSNPQLRVAFEPHLVKLHVIDEGIGIPAAEMANLFQAFYRASNTRTIQGTGLGLVISRQFVEFHGGTLEAQSELHQGTTFTVTLPVPAVAMA